MVLCCANKNNQHLQGFSHSSSTAERQAALRKQSNTNTGWGTQAHLFPGTALPQSGAGTGRARASTAQFQHTTPALPSGRSAQGLRHPPHQELSLRYGTMSIKTHPTPIPVLHHLLNQCGLWHSWMCHWEYLERWFLAKKTLQHQS